ncbi:MAG: HAD-IA family hydrolase [Pseudomonadota bacterium]
MKPQAIVFDIGNVLIEWQPERFYDAVIGKDRRLAMFAEVDLHFMNELVDRGENFTQTIYGAADKHPAWSDEIRMWHDRWIELASPAIDHSVRLMRALQSRDVPVYSLTNFGVESYDLAATYYPFLREFDMDFVSGHLKVTKPDNDIYRIVEDRSGLTGAALLFTDDRPENIAAAQTRGWATHLFEGPQGWADRLVAEGMLPTGAAN